MMSNHARRLLRSESGASAVELALIAPVFLALLLGGVQCGLLIFTQASLHYAVQKGVRCLALNSTCASASAYYFAPGPAPVFTPTTMTCGKALTGAVTYSLNVVVYQKDVSLSATACFPDLKSAAAWPLGPAQAISAARQTRAESV
jgi:Flp pilus assembly protein TadG